MEHNIQFGVSFDDESIIRSIKESAERKIIEDIKREAVNVIFDSRSPWREADPNRDPVSENVKHIITETLERWKPEIIQATAVELAARLARTKAAKKMLEDAGPNG